MTQVKQTDYDDMQMWGRELMEMHPGPRLPPVNQAPTALRSAAEYLAAATPAEAHFLRGRFIVGLRTADYYTEPKAIALLAILDIKAAKLRD